MTILGEKDGVFSEYCTHVTSMAFKSPDNVSIMEGGFTEPLAAVMHACELSNTELGETATVLGTRRTGLVTLISLEARGVSEIYVADVLDKRLGKARELGVVRVSNSRNENTGGFVNLYPSHKGGVIKAVTKM